MWLQRLEAIGRFLKAGLEGRGCSLAVRFGKKRALAPEAVPSILLRRLMS